MRKKTFTALLLIVLTGLPGCSGGTQTCRVTGLSPGYTSSMAMKIATEPW